MVVAKIQALRKFLYKHRHLLSAVSLFGGFIIDNLTLRRTDRLFENLALLGYILVVGISIILFHRLRRYTLRTPFVERVYLFLPFIIQFAFGGLFSGLTIFYGRSGTLAASGLFIAILFVMMVGTEFFKRQYQKIVFQITALFAAIFFMLIYLVPVLTGQMSEYMFLLSGGLALLITTAYIFIAERALRDEMQAAKRVLSTSIAFVFLFINILYFAHIIPPIPLVLKDAEPAYSITRTSTGYILGVEEKENSFLPQKRVVKVVRGMPLYIYSAIFAPTKINTTVVHDWQYYSAPEKKWVSMAEIPFQISGGREIGYRGYTYLSSLLPGKWRVDVKTSNNQIIGRLKFNVVETTGIDRLLYISK